MNFVAQTATGRKFSDVIIHCSLLDALSSLEILWLLLLHVCWSDIIECTSGDSSLVFAVLNITSQNKITDKCDRHKLLKSLLFNSYEGNDYLGKVNNLRGSFDTGNSHPVWRYRNLFDMNVKGGQILMDGSVNVVVVSNWLLLLPLWTNSFAWWKA